MAFRSAHCRPNLGGAAGKGLCSIATFFRAALPSRAARHEHLLVSTVPSGSSDESACYWCNARLIWPRAPEIRTARIACTGQMRFLEGCLNRTRKQAVVQYIRNLVFLNVLRPEYPATGTYSWCAHSWRSCLLRERPERIMNQFLLPAVVYAVG